MSLETPNFTSEDTHLTNDDSVRFGRLLKWMKDNGATIDDIEIRTWPHSYERGVFARREISNGLFAVIPRTISFNTLNALASASAPLKEFLLDIKATLGTDEEGNDRGALGMFLVYEKLVTKDKSFWFPYIDALPRSGIRYSSLLWSTQRELERWKIDRLVGGALKQSWGVIARMVEKAKARPDLFPFSAAVIEEEVKWAYYMVKSRAWSREPLEMIPFGDIMNHQVNSPVTLVANDTHNTFVMLGHSPIPAGAEVFDTYQKLPTPTLYTVSWGFIPGPEECFIPIEQPVNQFSTNKRRLLAKLGCLVGKDYMSLSQNCALKEFSNTTLNCLKAFEMEESQVKNATEWYRILKSKPNQGVLIEVSPQAEIKALEHVITTLTPLKSPLSKIEEALMMESGTDVVEKLAFRLRDSITKCLEQVIWLCKQHVKFLRDKIEAA